MCSQQLGHFVGQKVAEIWGQEWHIMFTTTRTLCGTKSGGNLRVRMAYNVHNNQDTFWDKKWRKLRVGKACNIHNYDNLWDKKWRKFEGWKGI